MNRRIASLAAAALLVGASMAATSASANGSVAVSIGLPGFAVGYSNRGYGYVAAAPYAYPAPYYYDYAPPVVAYPAPVVYAPYYRPYYARHYYYHHPYRVGYYGYRHW
jgi:hypothetical protein